MIFMKNHRKVIGREKLAEANILDDPLNIVMEQFKGSAKNFVRECKDNAEPNPATDLFFDDIS